MNSQATYIILGLELNRKATLEQFKEFTARISYVVDSLAKMYQMPALELELQGSDLIFGKNSIDLFPYAILDGLSWKMSQGYLLEDSVKSSETWPRSGMMQNGIVYRHRPLVPLTREIEFGLLPTLTATAYDKNQSTTMGSAYRPSIPTVARLFGLRPNPQFSEWIMGYGIDHTAIDSDFWEIQSSHKYQNGLQKESKQLKDCSK